jgi:hypothetical protein
MNRKGVLLLLVLMVSLITTVVFLKGRKAGSETVSPLTSTFASATTEPLTSTSTGVDTAQDAWITSTSSAPAQSSSATYASGLASSASPSSTSSTSRPKLSVNVVKARPRPVPFPGTPPRCSHDAATKAVEWSGFSGYGYLASRCDLIDQWLAEVRDDSVADGGNDITVWLAQKGYDSPAVDCTYRITKDRRLEVGDRVGVRERDGRIEQAYLISEWTQPVPEGFRLATVRAVDGNSLEFSSYGEIWSADGPVLDRMGFDRLWTIWGGAKYVLPIDPRAPLIEADLIMPCHAGLPEWNWGLSMAVGMPQWPQAVSVRR